MQKALASKFCSLIGLIVAVNLPLAAATHSVTVDGSGFSPSSLSIEVGDTVVWENVDEDFPHTTTCTLQPTDPDYWIGYLIDLGDTYSKTFNNTGTFDYTDQLDIGTGTITVTPVVTPTINLESPRIENSQFLFEATGLTVGKTNVLLASTNFTTWIPASTNVANTTSITFTNAVLGQCFFRVLELP